MDYLNFLIFLIIDLIDSIYIYTYNIYDYIFIIIIFSFLHFLQTISWGTLLSKRFWFSDGTWPGKVVLEGQGLGPTAWLRCWDAESVWISYSKTVGIIMIHYLRGVNFMNFVWISSEFCGSCGIFSFLESQNCVILFRPHLVAVVLVAQNEFFGVSAQSSIAMIAVVLSPDMKQTLSSLGLYAMSNYSRWNTLKRSPFV